MRFGKSLGAIPVLIAWGLFLADSDALAQVSGELVEPNVMLVIDTSGSMDWRDNQDPTGLLGPWYWSRLACLVNDNSNTGKTAWQKLQDAFLGGIDGSSYKCAVEPNYVRPSLHALDVAKLSSFLEDHNPNPDVIENNIGEFRNVTWPHFRAVNCPGNPLNPLQSYWVLNLAGHYQCIDVTDGANVKLMPDGFYCMTYNPDNPENGNSDVYIENGVEYCLNHHPKAQERQSNGILDRYATLARFGIMTYDNVPSCLGEACDAHDKLWDYGMCRDWTCEGLGEGGTHICPDWNAGARADMPGAIGGLVRITSDMQQSNQEVRKVLNTMEPLYCSPVGALLDDVGYYFSSDPNVLPKAVVNAFSSVQGVDSYYRCRPKVVILISDGQPTGAFEFAAGACGGTDELWQPDPIDLETHCTEENSEITPKDCPWRSSPEEAAELYDVGKRILGMMQGTGSAVDQPDQPILLVVIGFNVPEVDCEETPTKCIPYTATYYQERHCWNGLPECIPAEPDPDAGIGDPTETTCLMTPREFLNEVACQGWPYEPNRTYGNHVEEDFAPPWYGNESLNICEPPGYTGDPDLYICRDNERALFVNNTQKLSTALDLVIGNLSSNVATRTDLISWNVPVSSMDDNVALQYEFRTGYVARHGGPWMGVLTRADRGCSDGSAAVLEYQNVAEDLAVQQNRVFYSMTTPDDGEPLNENDYFNLGTANIVNWVEQRRSNDFRVSTIDSNDFDDCDFGVASEVGARPCNVNIVKDEVIRFLENRGLADIYNSTPAVLGVPAARTAVASLSEYILENGAAQGRRPHLFVGTNDGVLHAFDIEQMSTDITNVERWGYIPRSLIKRVREQFPMPEIILDDDAYHLGDSPESELYQHLFLLDGSPVARDVLMARDPSDLGSESGRQWRAVVFGGLGKGARGYYALDVTDPVKEAPDSNAEAPYALWELSPNDELYGNNDADTIPYLDKMGYSLSRPALAYVSDDITLEKTFLVAAAILPGGWDPDANKNTGVYIVRLGDGQVIRYLEPSYAGDTTAGMCPDINIGLAYEQSDNTLLEKAQLIGEPVVVHGTQSVRRAREAFIGDDRGRIWMIDMTEEDPDDWCLRLYFDTLIAWHFPYEECWPRHENDPMDPYSSCTPSAATCFHSDCCSTPDGEQVVPESKCAASHYSTRNMNGPRVMILGAPTIARNDNNETVMIFGTGQYDALSGWNRNRIFSITNKLEGENEDESKKLMPHINWWIGDFGLEKESDEFPDFSPGFPSGNSALKTWLDAIETEMEKTHITSSGWSGTSPDPVYMFNVGEKMIGRPVIFDGVAYFTTFVPIENPIDVQDTCAAGTSRLWALEYDAAVCKDVGECDYIPEDFEDPENTPIGQFVENGQNRLFRNYRGELLSGVQVARAPTCDNMDNPAFELRLQRSSSEATSGNPNVPSDTAVDVQRVAIDKNATVTVSKVRFDSWQIVFQ
ncbi:MAG: PilC/PilY family type IV pilus protein [Myxococcota bacterium]|nr:PilC/PilY family type IV pilus protein [Myxococcota bacterium]